ncbi:MAG: DUF1385 domain-containing protein [Synergistales bacterium]|jgi:uncharacterized protein YqhQ|nr:DUF1385 domain-containing protein [Synergistales bacterium]
MKPKWPVGLWWLSLMAAAEKIPVGGQAVIEGVLMRGPTQWGMAVRRPDGLIWTRAWGNDPWSSRGIWRYPVLRGMATMAEMLVIGTKALTLSAQVALGEEEDAGLTPWELALSLGVALAGVVVLFLLFPLWISGLLQGALDVSETTRHFLEGSLRAAVFVGYVAVIGLWKDMRRVFAYHGAEHKTINAWEADAALKSHVVGRYSRIHGRCGTSFILVVVAVSIVVFALFGGGVWWWKALSRIVLLPLVVGISYEIIRWASRDEGLGRAVMKPALCLQYLTTREPDEGQIEVALFALREALGDEKRS